MKLIYASPLLVALSFAAGDVAAVWGEGARLRDEVIAEYDMRDYGESWCLPLTVGGTRYDFWVDTGTGLIVFDDSLRHLLGKACEEHTFNTMNGDLMIPLFRAPEAHVGSLPVERPSRVGCLDLTALKQSAGFDIGGVLGCAFLRKFVIQFDFEKACLRFLKSVPDSPGFMVPFEGDDMRPHCLCDLEANTNESFMLDSGALGSCSATLRTGMFDMLSAEAATSTTLVEIPRLLVMGTVTMGTPNGIFQKQRWGILRRLTCGPVALERFRVERARYSALGLRFMARFIVTIDFPGRATYFTPIEGSEGDDFDSGVVIDRAGKRTFVRGIVPLHPAAGTGLSTGDEIIRVNGEETQRTNIFAVWRILGRIGEQATLEVKREDGSELTVRLPRRSK